MIEEEKTKINTKNVVFEESDYKIIKSLAQRDGYGPHGFSAALRRVIREWAGGIKPQAELTEGFMVSVPETAEAEKAAG